MTIKKEPDDNIYCHQAPGYTAKIVKTIPYSIHIEKNNQEQYFDYPKNLKNHNIYNPQIQISAESETKRSIFREKDKTKRSKKESAQHSKSRNKSFVMTSVSAL